MPAASARSSDSANGWDRSRCRAESPEMRETIAIAGSAPQPYPMAPDAPGRPIPASGSRSCCFPSRPCGRHSSNPEWSAQNDSVPPCGMCFFSTKSSTPMISGQESGERGCRPRPEGDQVFQRVVDQAELPRRAAAERAAASEADPRTRSMLMPSDSPCGGCRPRRGSRTELFVRSRAIARAQWRRLHQEDQIVRYCVKPSRLTAQRGRQHDRLVLGPTSTSARR